MQQILTAFMVLFAVIDITGSIPVVVDLNSQGKKVQAGKAAFISLAILVVFLFAGEALLRLFNTDIPSFAIAGSLVLFALAVEMTFNVELFRNDEMIDSQLSVFKRRYLKDRNVENIIVAIVLNMALVYFVLAKIHWVAKLIGPNGIYVSRRFFGVILLAMSVRLFVSNLQAILA